MRRNQEILLREENVTRVRHIGVHHLPENVTRVRHIGVHHLPDIFLGVKFLLCER